MRALLIALAALLVLPLPAEAAVKPLPVGPDVDYQLGGAAPVPPNVGIVVRDRRAAPAAGLYNVCYVNAFQTQPDERRFWRAHRRLLLERAGRPVTDQPGERGCWTPGRPRSARAWRVSSVAGSTAAPAPGTTRSSWTISTPGRAATA